jgi:hypothetical protein
LILLSTNPWRFGVSYSGIAQTKAGGGHRQGASKLPPETGKELINSFSVDF